MAPRDTDVCPHCGAEFRAGRPACPECGSDSETGWSEDGLTGYSHGLPDEFTEEDYDRILREVGRAPPRRPSTASIVRTFTLLALLAVLALGLLLTLG